MEYREQLERLKRSVKEWNEWRGEHPEIRPNLTGANLSGANLSGSHLSRTRLTLANLTETNLTGTTLTETYLNMANLSKATLTETYLSITNLNKTNLTEANLTGTKFIFSNLVEAKLVETNLTKTEFFDCNLTNANLNRAKFTGAHFSKVYLIGTDLTGTDLSGVHFSDTIFIGVDLSKVKGLETAIHHGPSTVNINSVILPTDKHTRNHFLRGVGFTETQIEYLPYLLTPRPIQYQSLFISNAHQDETIAQRLYTDLRKKDVPCWFAKHDLQPGNYYRQGIDQAIHTQDRVLLLLSEHSIQNGWVRYEVELALSRENDQQREILYPIRIDDAIFDCTANWARSLQATRHIGDFTNWQEDAAYQESFDWLLHDLKMNKPPTR